MSKNPILSYPPQDSLLTLFNGFPGKAGFFHKRKPWIIKDSLSLDILLNGRPSSSSVFYFPKDTQETHILPGFPIISFIPDKESNNLPPPNHPSLPTYLKRSEPWILAIGFYINGNACSSIKQKILYT